MQKELEKFESVEEYILFIAGYLKKPSESTSRAIPSFSMPNSPINLARYDVSVISNFAHQIHDNIGFTSKQCNLAGKIIVKYRRQMAKVGIDVAPVANGNVEVKLPIRDIDYSRKVSLEQDRIKIRFPFDQMLVQKLRTYGKNESHGSAIWDHEARYWNLALTEFNVMWTQEQLVSGHNFDADKEFDNVYKICKQAVGSVPKLKIDGDKIYMDNCPASLENFLIDKLGDFTLNNMVKLIDYAGVCGFDVSQKLLDKCTANELQPYFLNQEIVVKTPEEKDVENLLEYIKMSNRFPVVTYCVGHDQALYKRLTEQFSKTAVIDIKEVKEIDHLKTIPLLVTNTGLVRSGTTRQRLFQMAERIVFFYKDNEPDSVYGRNLF